jgi:hypothetical protein
LSLQIADQRLLLRSRQRIEHLNLLLHRQRHLRGGGAKEPTERKSDREYEGETLSTARPKT